MGDLLKSRRVTLECLAAGPAPDPKAGGDMWRVSIAPDGTQSSELIAGPSFEAHKRESTLPVMAPADAAAAGAPFSVDGKDARQQEVLRKLTAQADDLAREKFSGAIVYLFGAITKDPDYKRRFAAAQRYCERWGMTVLNPTRHPVPASGPLPVDYYMRHCLIDVEACEAMVPVPSPFLEGSAGAAAERAYGECLKKPILDGFVKEV